MSDFVTSLLFMFGTGLSIAGIVAKLESSYDIASMVKQINEHDKRRLEQAGVDIDKLID